jgi:hypothetical protein
VPSVTIWTRLEPRSGVGAAPSGERQPDQFALALQAQVRDPLWLLARQWQVGELRGTDGGSLIQATIRTESAPLTSYRPSLSGAGGPLDPEMPLEAQVERKPVELGLRGAVQLGLRFEALVPAAQLTAFRTEYPIDPTASADEYPSVEAARFRGLVAGSTVDGNALYEAIVDNAADLTQVPPLPALGLSQTEEDAVVTALESFRDYRRSLYTEPDQNAAWDAQRLGYEFSVGSESDAGDLRLDGTDFGGGYLDWYSFSAAAATLGGGQTAQTATAEWSFLPNNVSFPGIPNPRWWQFEDGRTDFGRTDVQSVDLAKLVVMHFALVGGDEWFMLPLPLASGSLSRVRLLVVTDTFGVRTVIRPTGELPMPGGASPWEMFTLSGTDGGVLLLPPTVAHALDGPELEQVSFIRDEVAALGWGIERVLQGPMDAPLDGYEPWRLRLEADPPPPPRQQTPGGPAIQYVAGTTVPDNWIPLVPEANGPRSFLFRRGAMEIPGAAGSLEPVYARGRLLEPERSPYYVNEEAIPRAGVQASRSIRRTRWINGETIVWEARRVRPGRGEGSSGLAFDRVEDLSPAP